MEDLQVVQTLKMRVSCLLAFLLAVTLMLPGLQHEAHAAFGDRFMFASPIYGVNESDGSITLTVIRKDHIEEGVIIHFGVGGNQRNGLA